MNIGGAGEKEVVDELSQYNVVVVSGPQRSGTTITSKMLAEDLGYEWVNEFDGRFQNNFESLRRLIALGGQFVVQGPAICSAIHRLSEKGVAVVIMIRDREDIIKSQDRISWSKRGEPTEFESYRKTWGVSEGRICDVKYEIWQKQKEQIQVPYYEMHYDCEYMTSHRLYKQKEERRNFGPKQTA